MNQDITSLILAEDDFKIVGNQIIAKSSSGKLGFIDIRETELDTSNIDSVEYIPATQSFIMSINGLYGIVNKDCKELVSVTYQKIESIGKVFVATSDSGKNLFSCDCMKSMQVDECSLIDTLESVDGKLISGEEKHRNSPHLQYLNEIYKIEDKGLYVVTSGSKVGVVNKFGDIIVPVSFYKVGLGCADLILAFNGKQMILYSLDGHVISDYYDDIIVLTKYLNSSFEYESRYDYPAFYVKRNQKIGVLSFYNNEFHVEYPCIFDELNLGKATFEDRIWINNTLLKEEILGPYGNKIKKSDKFIWCSDFNYNGLAVAADYLGNFCIVNDKFRFVEDLKYSKIIEIDPFHYVLIGVNDLSENLFNSHIQSSIVKYEKRHKALLNTYPYRVVTKITSDLFIVQQDGLYGVVKYSADDEHFTILLAIVYEEIRYEELTIIVKKEGLYGCYNLNGECILDIQYISVKPFDGDNTRHMLTQDLFRFKSCYRGHLLEVMREDGNRYVYSGLSEQYQSFDANTCLNICYFNKDSNKEDFILTARNDNGIQFFSLCLRKKSEIYTCTEFSEYNYRESGCSVMINDKYGYIDFLTFHIIPCIHEQRVVYLDDSHRFWKLDDSDQIYDSHLNLVHNIPLCRDIQPFNNGTWRVSVFKNSNSRDYWCSPKVYGLYTSDLECIIPIGYHDITVGLDDQFIASSHLPFDEYHGLKYEECSIYNTQGEKLYTCTNQILVKNDTHNQKYYLIEGSPSLVSINGREFFDLAHGHIVKEFISDHCSHYYSGTNHDGSRNIISSFGKEYRNVEVILTKEGITILKIRGRYIAISEEKELTPTSHYRIVVNTSRKYITLMNYYKKVFIDYEGNYIGQIEGKFCNWLVDKSSGVITAISKNDSGMEEYRLYSLDGTLINSTVFSFIGTFSEGYATCVINSEEKLDKDFFKNAQSEFFFFYNRNNYGKWGIIDSKGEIIIPMKYDFIRAVKEGKATYLENLKYGILNIHTRTVTSAEFDFLHHFSEGLCIFKEFFRTRWSTESKCGFIDEEGRVRIPAIYKTATPFKSGRSKVTSFDGYVNMIDINGSHLQNWELPHMDYESDEDDGWSGYSASELEEMYRDAMGGDPANQWNID